MKNIGILGVGVVGRSILEFFKKQNKSVDITVWDECKNSSQISILEFLKSNDINFFSPGISYKKYFDFYQKFPNKCLGELDVFAKYFDKPAIAVTGSLGKTTIAKLISVLLSKSNFNVGLGGNIGYPMLDLIKEKNKLDFSVLELSSFQLFLNKKFAPKIAIWSNFYPNHLNWHETENHYFDSKFKIFEFQKQDGFSLFPVELIDEKNIEKFKSLKSTLCFVSNSNINFDKQLLSIKDYLFFYVEGNFLKYEKIINYKVVKRENIFNLSLLPQFSFIQNWIYVIASIFLLGIDLKKLKISSEDFNFQDKIFEHRLEFFVSINNIDFYNDSKSTVFQATESAIEKLNKNGKPIILILGGLGKGVDRSKFIKSLDKKYKNLKEILFFGSESNLFQNIKTYSDLNSALKEIKLLAKPGDQVLFSPSGSSFDLFDNYMHRGKVFKDLVLKMYTPN